VRRASAVGDAQQLAGGDIAVPKQQLPGDPPYEESGYNELNFEKSLA
jgi:hypothetical protein